MKTILYNPIFINPQAYYVFPRLTRYLQPDNESTSEPANYIGTIEVKVIAYGDTTLKRTYTNTDSIDLSEFKNTWIRISLFTKVGSCVLGEWKIGNMESDLPYIDPEVLASLKAVVIVGNKTNNDSDRAIVKNLVDPDNPFVISNAAYTEGSGYADKDSPYYGAFVTDGVNDLITSTKTVQEMLVGSNEITVVSMIHLVQTPSASSEKTYTNQIRTGQNYLRNYVTNNGKTGIYGYTYKGNNVSVINNILGDKNDYTVENKSWNNLAKFSVIGYEDNGTINELDQVAWYWTIIANKVLTTDQINQVIAYYNLDRTLKPDILCNIDKQGITNDNHADFNDKLVDYSGNGRDIQMNNLAWKGGSGIAAKPFETIKDYAIVSDEARQKLTIYNEFSYKIKSNTPSYYWTVQSIIRDNTSYQVTIITDKDCYWINATNFINSEGNKESIRKKYPVLANTPTQVIICGLDQFEYPEGIEPTNAVSYVNLEYAGEITITFIPSHKGGLLLDGVNDFGKVTGMPVYKDYTVVTDREIFTNTGAISSKNNPGAFVETSGNSVYSFGQGTSGLNFISTRSISYLSKYSYCGQSIAAGAAEDGTDMWLGTTRDNDSRFFNGAIYSLMSFPYSMSEFLIERQLKKHKLGTLYPDMVEFRPIVKSNNKWDTIEIWQGNKSLYRPAVNDNKTGIYLKKNSTIGIYVKPKDADEVTKIVVNGTEYTNIKINSNGFYYVTLPITKSPQKINITIDEYIRYEEIVQPYPVLLRFDDENGNEVSWGGKFRVGSTITRIGSAADSNLLPNIYNIFGLLLNDNQVTSSKIIVEKTMVFKAKSAYIFDNNEPKCILSPRLLRIPNSSYKILGYIPDISGHGNNGKINNSAYASMSGANGYLLDFKTFTTGNSSLVNIKDDSRIEVININKEKSATWVNLNKSTSISLSSQKIKVTGMKSGDTLGYYYSESTDATLRSKFDIKSDGIYSLPSSIANSNNIGGIAFDVIAGADSAYRIEQIGEYEGAYCLDGVDDFVTIPTTVGGKQVLMKVNWDKTIADAILYDQRGYPNEFAIYNADMDNNNNPVFAYQARNNGQTYIDGILNKNIKASELRAITHNITITNELSTGTNTSSPVIGSNKVHNAYFTNMALYDFMLFDEISTDDKILELNEYVGIEGNTDDLFNETN